MPAGAGLGEVVAVVGPELLVALDRGQKNRDAELGKGLEEVQQSFDLGFEPGVRDVVVDDGGERVGQSLHPRLQRILPVGLQPIALVEWTRPDGSRASGGVSVQPDPEQLELARAALGLGSVSGSDAA